jgi:ATP-dependent Lon protease
MPQLLPLFPLQLVAFPGSAVPLHIFEDRYKEMVGEAEATGTEFGIVLSKDGGIVNTGCTVVVEAVPERYPDGRFNVLVRGKRRFSLLAINEDKAYLQGEVEYFDDEDWSPVSPALRDQAIQAYQHIRQTLREAGDDPNEPDPDLSQPRLSFELAPIVDDLDFQNTMLRSRSESERLQQFIDAAEPYLARRSYKAKMQRSAPLNGTGHRPASL